MSYILDALRRADAERERGAVPTLHTQQFLMQGDDEERRGGASGRLVVGLGIGIGLALAGALAWKFLGGDAPPVPAPAANVAAAAAAPSTFAPISADLASQRAASMPALPNAAVIAVSSPASISAEGRRGSRRTVATAAASNEPAPASSPSTTRVVAQADLPDDIKRTLPRLSINGASYSNDAASRMLIINGQVLHEGDKVANGFVLQQIKLKSAVIAGRNFRYEITY